MANATVSNLGQINAAGATDALFLKKFAGEVLTTFHKKTQFMSRHMVRTIQNGKSAQFPGTGLSSAAYHTPGAEIVGTAIPHAETVITVDDLLVSSAFIAKIDEAKNHYDVRSIYSTEIADALYQTFDGNIAKVVILAARASSALSSITLPTRAFTDANYRIDGEKLAAGVFRAAQALDEGNVSGEDRCVAVLPAQYYLLGQTTKVINKDWGGSGVYADGTVLRVAGVEIVKTNNLPQTNVTTGPSAYQGNFTNTAAVVWQKGAAGTVKLLDLATEMAYDIRRQGTLLVAKYAMGHGVLRPECAVELKVA